MTSAAAEDIQLGEDAAQVGFRRGFADVKVRADFLVALAAGQDQEREGFQLATDESFAADASRQFGPRRWGNGGSPECTLRMHPSSSSRGVITSKGEEGEVPAETLIAVPLKDVREFDNEFRAKLDLGFGGSGQEQRPVQAGNEMPTSSLSFSQPFFSISFARFEFGDRIGVD